ncbi:MULTISPECIES: WhiB family transcriptional regulator [unclassified Streptomyces]|uniref:WhiB family transcriptional regulator n=1 Tax=unclassified Streptomyces TaxID=2593676 RepID=UPI0036F76AD7
MSVHPRRSRFGAGPARDVRPWLDGAACADEDPELFFPLVERESDPQVAAARGVCRRCGVLTACRSWALEQGEDAGIWGATTAAQRRAMSRGPRSGSDGQGAGRRPHCGDS